MAFHNFSRILYLKCDLYGHLYRLHQFKLNCLEKKKFSNERGRIFNQTKLLILS